MTICLGQCFMSYDSKQEFIASIRDLDFPVMLERTVDAGAAYQRKPARERDAEYLNFLGGVAFWLRYRIRPQGLCREDFLLLRPIAEELVKKGQLDASLLGQFG